MLSVRHLISLNLSDPMIEPGQPCISRLVVDPGDWSCDRP
jgi:hypothetical protein